MRQLEDVISSVVVEVEEDVLFIQHAVPQLRSLTLPLRHAWLRVLEEHSTRPLQMTAFLAHTIALPVAVPHPALPATT